MNSNQVTAFLIVAMICISTLVALGKIIITPSMTEQFTSLLFGFLMGLPFQQPDLFKKLFGIAKPKFPPTDEDSKS